MSKRKKYLTCSRKYDLPLFCAAWTAAVVPKPRNKEDGAAADDGAGVAHVVFGGGGGNRKSGVKNKLLLAHYDFASDMLSEAVYTLSTDDDPPYRLAVHPGSNKIVCSISKDCRLLELNAEEDLKLEVSKRVVQPLQDIGEQNCLVFSGDGTRLATGGEDGHLRVFEWPSLELVMDQAGAHTAVKDIDFSLDGSLLVSTGDAGPCRVWDLSKASAVTSLSASKGANLGLCRFSRDGTKPFLFITMREGSKGVISIWNSTTWKMSTSKRLSEYPISAFAISPDGRFLAIGNSEGDVKVLNANNLGVVMQVKSAHMVFVTSMEFSPNSRALLSVSGDSSARVTAISEPTKREGWRIYMLMFLLLLLSYWFFIVRKQDEAGGDLSVRAVISDVLVHLGVRR
ncbi:prolactin regulatory element-binding protein [Marchantia polymorpha subsp. ruderalis]|uniref:Anaphase-promoting complex subunit 4-like WD40 domain-containing protein n=2 Tax=Marchantia polymorpha TaxID=3197 RepID=A0AAF6BXK5_MARPO|nr:hypothetical protein MARPO_0068s0040 [Marchantia polymorpha]BBN16739.1 hypothetical protein Mp_7g08870 [Marchantia polymorpha subsp. ruderalis]|eukprot:PTQ35821.1 hypothetical protein MARPO_0068s0040 [Marchantia polymorpha]